MSILPSPLLIVNKIFDPEFPVQNRRMTRICNAAGVTRKTLYHNILLVVGEQYNLRLANRVYADEVGHSPEYALDVVAYFPQLAEIADNYLDRIEKIQARKED